MNLDDELRRTFRQKPAPPGLADRVLARIAEGRLPPSPPSGFGEPGKPAPTTKDIKPAPTIDDEPAPTSSEDTVARARMPASPTCPPQLQRRRKLREGGARLPLRAWLAAAAAVTLMAAGGARYYLHQQTVAYQQTVAKAEQVQADIRLALQITGEKLALVQRKVEDSQR